MFLFVFFLCDLFFEDMKNRLVFSSDFGTSKCGYFVGLLTISEIHVFSQRRFIIISLICSEEIMNS